MSVKSMSNRLDKIGAKGGQRNCVIHIYEGDDVEQKKSEYYQQSGIEPKPSDRVILVEHVKESI